MNNRLSKAPSILISSRTCLILSTLSPLMSALFLIELGSMQNEEKPVQKINTDGFAASYKPFYGDHPISWHLKINGFDVEVDLQKLTEKVLQNPEIKVDGLVEAEILAQLENIR